MRNMTDTVDPRFDTGYRTVVVVTASNDRQAAAVESELAARQQAGMYGETVRFFVVPDPSSARVGSGGATFNALLTVEELLVSSDMSSFWSLSNSRIFMIHSGGDSQRLPLQSVCGKAWCSLPLLNKDEDLDAPIDYVLTSMFNLFRDVKTGLMIASSDVLFQLPDDFTPYWPQVGATGLGVRAKAEVGVNHGVFHVARNPDGTIDEARCIPHVSEPFKKSVYDALSKAPKGSSTFPISNFFQKESVPTLRSFGAVDANGDVLIDTGLIYFSPPAALTLLKLAHLYPLDCCSYLGVDMTRKPLRIELYSDLMIAMSGGSGSGREFYMNSPTAESDLSLLASAREIIWEHLSEVPLFCLESEGTFTHVGTSQEYLDLLVHPRQHEQDLGLCVNAAVVIDESVTSKFNDTYGNNALREAVPLGSRPPVPNSHNSTEKMKDIVASNFSRFVCLNSILHNNGSISENSVIEHSELTGEYLVGSGCIVSTVRTVPNLVLRAGYFIQELHTSGGVSRVCSLLRVNDPIKEPFTSPRARVCGVEWRCLFETLGVDSSDIWDADVPVSQRSLWTARLFPEFPTNSPWKEGNMHYLAADQDLSSDRMDPLDCDRATTLLQWLAEVDSKELLQGLTSFQLTEEDVRKFLQSERDEEPSSPVQTTGRHTPVEFRRFLRDSHAAFMRARRLHMTPQVISVWRRSHRLSLKELLERSSPLIEFSWRRQLRAKVDLLQLCRSIEQPLLNLSIGHLIRRIGRGALPLSSVAGGVGTPASDILHPHLLQSIVVYDGSKLSDRESAPSKARTSTRLSNHELGSIFFARALASLDRIAESSNASVAARAMAVEAALIWTFAGWGNAETFAGPAHHADFLGLFRRLQPSLAGVPGLWGAVPVNLVGGKVVEQPAVLDRSPRGLSAELAHLRARWLARAHMAGRLARHLERASQLFIARAVCSAPVRPPTLLNRSLLGSRRSSVVEGKEDELDDSSAISPASPALTPFLSSPSILSSPAQEAACRARASREWTVAASPIRVDLCGAWSDTPPITMEKASLPPEARQQLLQRFGPTSSEYVGLSSAGGGFIASFSAHFGRGKPVGCRVRALPPGQALIFGSSSTPHVKQAILRSEEAKVELEDADMGHGSSSIGSAPRNVMIVRAYGFFDGREGDRRLPTGTFSVPSSSNEKSANDFRSPNFVPPGTVSSSVTLRCRADFADYNQPHAEGALVKAALLLLGFFGRQPDLELSGPDREAEEDAFSELLQQRFGGSVEIETWSDVPHGSGLGTSSILAACVIAALAKKTGQQYDQQSVFHLVLMLEQLLTTGGGWQDQLAIVPGVKLGFSPSTFDEIAENASLSRPNDSQSQPNAISKPLLVDFKPLADPLTGFSITHPSVQVHDFIENRIILVYSGKTRLAKNILQRVLRLWAVRNDTVVSNVSRLQRVALAAALAVGAGDAEALAEAVAEMCQLKNAMAVGSVTADVKRLFNVMDQFCLAACPTGAGGGGFVFGVLREGFSRDVALKMLKASDEIKDLDWAVYQFSIDSEGMVVL